MWCQCVYLCVKKSEDLGLALENVKLMHLCRYLQIAGDLCFLIHCAYMESRGPESKAQVNGNEQNVKKMKKEFKIFSF